MDPTYGERRELSIDELKGRHVIDRMGNEVGSVSDIAIDPDAWRVSGVILSVRKDVADRLHLDRPLMGDAQLDISPDRIQNVGDNVMLNVDLDAIAGRLSGVGHPGSPRPGPY